VFAGVRFVLAGLLLLPFSRSPLWELPKGSLWPLMSIALTQTFGQYLFFYSGLSVSSGVLSSLLVSTGSLWWVLLAPVMLGSPKPGRRQWLLLGLSTVGITIAVYKPGAGAGDPMMGAVLFRDRRDSVPTTERSDRSRKGDCRGALYGRDHAHERGGRRLA
jgi:drug/metabolite transporter (DMT)-like permease